MGILYKFQEFDNVSGVSGTTPGIGYYDYTIPNDKKWSVHSAGVSASMNQAEGELLYSEDSGTSWCNPYDSPCEKIICMHNDGKASEVNFAIPLEFTGSGTSVIFRLQVKNYNTLESEITIWINGREF